jgi:membrane protein DedA with SNARE-associated domain
MVANIFSYPVHLLLMHGYAALFVWSVLEGEIGLMLAGWLASEHRVFTYSDVIMVAMAGAVLGDLLVFMAGRLFEKRALAWLDAHPDKKRMALAWLRKWGPFVIVFERFVYGTHIPVLLTIGMSGYRFAKFLFFDILGIVLWAFTFVSIGYFFGHNAIDLILFAQKNLFVVLFFLLLFTLILFSQNGDNR